MVDLPVTRLLLKPLILFVLEEVLTGWQFFVCLKMNNFLSLVDIDFSFIYKLGGPF